MNALFSVHTLNLDSKQRAQEIACAFDDLLEYLERNCPESRELSIVKTKLEEACFYAKKAMANDLDNQEKP